MEKLYTIPEVAEILGIKLLTAQRWVTQNKLPSIRLNGSYKSIRIPSSLLEAYIEKAKLDQAETSKVLEYKQVLTQESIYQ